MDLQVAPSKITMTSGDEGIALTLLNDRIGVHLCAAISDKLAQICLRNPRTSPAARPPAPTTPDRGTGGRPATPRWRRPPNYSLSGQNPIRFLGFAGGAINSWIASNPGADMDYPIRALTRIIRPSGRGRNGRTRS